MRWHNGPIRRSQNPYSEEVFQDCLTIWEESLAHSILARSLFTPPKAVYICADQPCPSLFRLQLGGGPYIPSAPQTTFYPPKPPQKAYFIKDLED
jgi:hypothetical protein